jgi:hypothetical protein
MRTALVFAGLAAAGLVGALAAHLVSTEPETASQPPTVDSGLEDRVARLESSFERFREEVLTRLDAPPLPESAPTALRADPASAELAAPLAEASLSDDVIKEKVKAAIEERAKAQAEERTKRFAAMAAERETAMLDRLEGELGLNAHQRDELEKILANRRTAMMEFREKMMSGDGGDRETMREEMRKIRDDSNAEIKALLTPEQYETFQSQQSRGGGPGGGFRGGGGGGRGR